MREVKFYFGDGETFDGFTDDSYWNGFINVWVTYEVHQQVIKHFEDMGCDDDETGLRQIEFDQDGLVSYANGFATCELDAMPPAA